MKKGIRHTSLSEAKRLKVPMSLITVRAANWGSAQKYKVWSHDKIIMIRRKQIKN